MNFQEQTFFFVKAKFEQREIEAGFPEQNDLFFRASKPCFLKV